MMKYDRNTTKTSSPSYSIKPTPIRQSFPQSSTTPIQTNSNRGNIKNYSSIITTPTNKKFQLSKKIKPEILSPLTAEQKEKEIERIKLKTQEIEHEKKLLRTKTAKMRRTISERNASINKVFTAPTKNEQSIKTTSFSMMTKLKRNYDTLLEQKNKLEIELSSCENSDNYWFSNELLIEVRSLFEDQERLKDIVNEARRNDQEICNNERDAKIAVSKSSLNEIKTEMDDINYSISELQKKCASYDRGKSKIKNFTTLSNIQEKKISVEDAIGLIKKDISDLERQIKCNKIAMKNAEKSTNNAIEQLYIIYHDSIIKIEEAIRKKKQSVDVGQNSNIPVD